MRWIHVLVVASTSSTGLAFLLQQQHIPPAPAAVTVARRPRASSASSLLHPRRPPVVPATVRPFTVGGEAPDGPSLQEVFNTATAISAAIVGGLVALELYQERPRGWVNEAIVEAAPSTLGPQAGRGLFALADIPKGTTIGEYPGVIIPKAAWVARKEGEAAVVLASRYAWTLADGASVLDPTLPSGDLPEVLVALGGLIRKPTLLALVNEPPVGVDVNLLPTVTAESVAFVAERDIYQGEELWIDYGPMYNRAHYRRR